MYESVVGATNSRSEDATRFLLLVEQGPRHVEQIGEARSGKGPIVDDFAGHGIFELIVRQDDVGTHDIGPRGEVGPGPFEVWIVPIDFSSGGIKKEALVQCGFEFRVTLSLLASRRIALLHCHENVPGTTR